MNRESQRQRLERCQTQVEEHPERASSYYNLGVAYSVSGRVKQAEEAFEKALELDPGLAQAWVNLGGVKLLRWDFEGCLKANQKAAAIDDSIPEVHFNMGQAYLYLNDPENLVRCNQRVLEIDRNHGAAHYYCAVGHLAMDELGATEKHVERAMALGHTLPQDFVKALNKARQKNLRNANVSLIEITGAENPDKNKEE